MSLWTGAFFLENFDMYDFLKFDDSEFKMKQNSKGGMNKSAVKSFSYPSMFESDSVLGTLVTADRSSEIENVHLASVYPPLNKVCSCVKVMLPCVESNVISFNVFCLKKNALKISFSVVFCYSNKYKWIPTDSCLR